MTPDKSKEVFAEIALVNDRLHFKGTVDGNEPVSIDYVPPLGDNLGYTSLELLLLSLSSCLGTAVLTFLRKKRKTITGLTIKSHGIRHQEHPTGFKTIELYIELHSTDTSDEELAGVIKMGEDTYCPVFAMVKGNVEIKYTRVIVD
jgi:putative redox protein